MKIMLVGGPKCGLIEETRSVRDVFCFDEIADEVEVVELKSKDQRMKNPRDLIHWRRHIYKWKGRLIGDVPVFEYEGIQQRVR